MPRRSSPSGFRFWWLKLPIARRCDVLSLIWRRIVKYYRSMVVDGIRIYPGRYGDLHARMFSPLDGIVEDPATGSAAAATAALLSTLARDGQIERSWRIHQGVDMGRPSVLMARTTRRNDGFEGVHVAGRCVAVMRRDFEVDAPTTASGECGRRREDGIWPMQRHRSPAKSFPIPAFVLMRDRDSIDGDHGHSSLREAAR